MSRKTLGALSALALCLALAPAAAFADELDWTGWTALTGTVTEIGGGAGARYYLADDVTISQTLQIKGGTEENPVVLDLNGHVLMKTGDGGAVRVADGAHLVLRDSRPDVKNGYRYSMNEYDDPVLYAPGDTAPEDATEIVGGIVAGRNASSSGSAQGGGVYVAAGGFFAMEGGSIAVCAAHAGGGVAVAAGGSFAMSGGASIVGCAAHDGGGVFNYGEFTMSGGSIADCRSIANEGGGVHNGEDAVFTMGGGSISGCKATYGGGVANYGEFTMSGGAIRSCAISSGGSYGGGVANHDSFTMKGSSSISGCTAATYGGGVANSGEFTMKGSSSIEDCKSVSDSGGVENSGSFTMEGGAIRNCESGLRGGGVCNFDGFTMSGGEIEDCTAKEGGDVCNSSEMDAQGGIVRGSVLNSQGSIANASGVGGTAFLGTVTNGEDGVISGGVFRGKVENVGGFYFFVADGQKQTVYVGSRISGGTFEGTVTNGRQTGEVCSSISGGTFEAAVTNEGEISGGTFEGTVTNGRQTGEVCSSISGGTFEAAVTNEGEISGGAFRGEVTNGEDGVISGGLFRGEVRNAGAISGGVFYWIASGGSFLPPIANEGGTVDSPHYVTFDPGCDGADPAAYGPATVAGGDTVLPEPAEPGREGWTLDGWFADGSSEPYGFDEPVTSDLALRAGWTHVAHTGGAATCTQRAICEVCGNEYGGEPGHGNVEHVAAKAATERSEGNIEHWRCLDCGRYYADEALTREVSPSDVVLPRLEPAPAAVLAETGDAAPAAAAAVAALTLAGGAAALLARRRCA